MRKDAIDELFEDEYEKNDSNFINFLHNFASSKDDKDAKNIILDKFYFEDYTVDELVKIGLSSLDKFAYKVDEQLYYQVVKNNYNKSNDHSNGRWIRNFNEKLIRIMSQRISNTNEDDVNTITIEDLEQIKE